MHKLLWLVGHLPMMHAGISQVTLLASHQEAVFSTQHADTSAHRHLGPLPKPPPSPHLQITRLSHHQPSPLYLEMDRGQSSLFVLQHNTRDAGLHKEAKHLLQRTSTILVWRLCNSISRDKKHRFSSNLAGNGTATTATSKRHGK